MNGISWTLTITILLFGSTLAHANRDNHGRVVDFNTLYPGTEQLSFALELPYTASGMIPALSFSYHEMVAGGPLGVGWLPQVGGLITSCDRLRNTPFSQIETTLDPTNVNPALLDGQQQLCFDGTHLVSTQPQFQPPEPIVDAAEVDPLIDSSEPIIRLGSNSAGLYFMVTNGEGLLYEYGRPAESKLKRSNRFSDTLAWRLNAVRDPVGNAIEYRYSSGGVFSHLTGMDYANFSVVFQYDRDASGDATRSVSSDEVAVHDHGLIRSINVSAGYLELFSFKFNYATYASNDPKQQGSEAFDLLQSIEQCFEGLCSVVSRLQWQVEEGAVADDRGLQRYKLTSVDQVPNQVGKVLVMFENLNQI